MGFVDIWIQIIYNFKAFALYRKKELEVVFNEENLSTEQKETPKGPWLQSPYENSWRTSRAFPS